MHKRGLQFTMHPYLAGRVEGIIVLPFQPRFMGARLGTALSSPFIPLPPQPARQSRGQWVRSVSLGSDQQRFSNPRPLLYFRSPSADSDTIF